MLCATQGLASIGIEVTVNSTELNYVTDIGDIGGTPSDLDATCLKDSMKKNVPGVQDTKAFEVTYLFDNSAADSDYRVLRGLQTAGEIVPGDGDLPRRAPPLPPPATSAPMCPAPRWTNWSPPS